MKRALVIAVLVLAIIGGGLYWLYTSLDVVVKTAIERFGPDITGVAVQVAQVRISAADGKGTIRGFTLGNPPGFKSPRAMQVGEITVGVEPASLRSDVVVIRDILVDSPQISYELGGGSNNLETIQRNIERYVKRTAGEGEGREPGSAKTAGRRYAIGRVTLRNARVTMTNPLLKGGGITFDIPDIDLRDVGRRPNGVTAAEAAKTVAAALTAKIAQKLLTNLELLRRGGAEGAIDALRGLLK
jgi:uncharacterized protein involved in outer membrane biogenesis